MPVTSVRSGWASGNLVFEGRAAGSFVRFGVTDRPLQIKVHNRVGSGAAAILGSTVEVRARPNSATAEHFAVDSTVDWRPDGATVTAGGIRAIQGVSRLDTDKTITGGAIIGVYGQVANNGTANGGGVMMAAGYFLVEDGGVYTAVSHLASAWLDSHLTKTVTAGESEFLYISNNGTTTYGQAIYVYAGNKITNLFNINTAAGMATITGVPSTLAGSIRVKVDAATKYIPLYDSPTGG